MLGKTTNELLQKTEQQIEAKIDPKFHGGLEKAVTAGLMVMYSPETHDMVTKQLQQEGDPTEVAGEGIAKLMGLLFNKSKATMPMQVLFPAATILMCEGLDFMEKAGKIQITNETISQTMANLSSSLLQLLHIDKNKMNNAINQGVSSIKQEAAQKNASTSGIIGNAMGGA